MLHQSGTVPLLRQPALFSESGKQRCGAADLGRIENSFRDAGAADAGVAAGKEEEVAVEEIFEAILLLMRDMEVI